MTAHFKGIWFLLPSESNILGSLGILLIRVQGIKKILSKPLNNAALNNVTLNIVQNKFWDQQLKSS